MLEKRSNAIVERMNTLNVRYDACTFRQIILTEAWSYVADVVRGKSSVKRIDTVYSKILRNWICDALNTLTKEHDLFRENLMAAFVEGSVAAGCAVPLHRIIGEQALPPVTGRLMLLFYRWIFTAPQAGSALSQSGFRGSTMSSDIDLRLFFDVPPEESKQEIAKYLQDCFANKFGFSPQIECRKREWSKIVPSDVLRGQCVFGEKLVTEALANGMKGYSNNAQTDAVYEALYSTVSNLSKEKHISDICDRDWLETADVIAESIIDENTGNRVYDSPASLHSSEWYRRNEMFFRSLEEQDFSQLITEDATGSLADGKGGHKEVNLTILRVKGVKTTSGQFIEATDVVIKARGLSENKGATENCFDVVKEYSSYMLLHQKFVDATFIPEIGPLLLTLPELQVDDQRIVGEGIGFFMSDLMDAGSDIYTVRAHQVSSLVEFPSLIAKLARDFQHKGVSIGKVTLARLLFPITFGLWCRGIGISMCDMALFVDQHGSAWKLMIFDFERHSFSELASEKHPILQALVDIKTYLPKRGDGRQRAFTYLFNPEEGRTRDKTFPFAVFDMAGIVPPGELADNFKLRIRRALKRIFLRLVR